MELWAGNYTAGYHSSRRYGGAAVCMPYTPPLCMRCVGAGPACSRFAIRVGGDRIRERFTSPRRCLCLARIR